MMLQAILRRTGISVATLFVVSILIFVGTSILPGDVAEIILGQMATPESLAALRTKLGIDQPPHIRYFMWLGNLLSGDLGISKAGSGFGTIGTPISTMISGRLGNTLLLAGVVGGALSVEPAETEGGATNIDIGIPLATGNELKSFCRENLPTFMTPDYFQFMKELPKTGTGKILKNELKKN